MTGLWITSWTFTLGMIKPNLSFSLPKKWKNENWNSGHTLWWHQNPTILKSNVFRLWVRQELVGGDYGFESYK